MSMCSKYFKKYLLFGAIFALSACVTVPEADKTGANFPNPDVENPGVIIIAEPVLTPKLPEPIPAPPPPVETPPEVPVYELPNEFADLDNWIWSNIDASFVSFQNSCKSWEQADQNAMLNPNLPQYGKYSDWQEACNAAQIATNPHRFFEAFFTPVQQSTPKDRDGLLTGYYEPEMDVRLTPDAEFYEPILSKPKDLTIQNRPRAQLSARSSRVIAYGRPIDVFFLQIQGSGRLRFKDGNTLRAAYAGNNGKPYKSIGKVLVDRGELTVEKSSKQAIEDWMKRNGRKAARELMNENPRYIFFTEQKVENNEGPRGAMRVPLTAMGSMAVDPRYHPYGVPVWLDTTLPQMAGDFKGQKQSILVMAQDTGNAIRGPLRGDLFFGSGSDAGERAGVMKHRASWSVFLPKALAAKNKPKPSS